MFVLTACDTPQVGFHYDAKEDIRVGANTFTVFHSRFAAQALRHNWLALRDEAQALADAQKAIHLVTGCAIWPHSFRGDPGLMKVRLRCPDTS